MGKSAENLLRQVRLNRTQKKTESSFDGALPRTALSLVLGNSLGEKIQSFLSILHGEEFHKHVLMRRTKTPPPLPPSLPVPAAMALTRLAFPGVVSNQHPETSMEHVVCLQCLSSELLSFSVRLSVCKVIDTYTQ